jgi:hypothetical protein
MGLYFSSKASVGCEIVFKNGSKSSFGGTSNTETPCRDTSTVYSKSTTAWTVSKVGMVVGAVVGFEIVVSSGAGLVVVVKDML